jgi:hypothetical protein
VLTLEKLLTLPIESVKYSSEFGRCLPSSYLMADLVVVSLPLSPVLIDETLFYFDRKKGKDKWDQTVNV